MPCRGTNWADHRHHARVLLSLVAIEGLSHEEAAEVLGVPVGTVGSRLHNARRKLVAAMSG